MAFNRDTVDSSSSEYNVNEIVENDFANSTIFVPIEKNFVLSFFLPK